MPQKKGQGMKSIPSCSLYGPIFSAELIDFDRIHSWINFDRIRWAVENAAIVCGLGYGSHPKGSKPNRGPSIKYLPAEGEGEVTQKRT